MLAENDFEELVDLEYAPAEMDPALRRFLLACTVYVWLLIVLTVFGVSAWVLFITMLSSR